MGAIAGYLFHLWQANGYANIRSVATAVTAFSVLALVGRAGKVGFQPFDLQTATLIAVMFEGAGAADQHHSASRHCCAGR